MEVPDSIALIFVKEDFEERTRKRQQDAAHLICEGVRMRFPKFASVDLDADRGVVHVIPALSWDAPILSYGVDRKSLQALAEAQRGDFSSWQDQEDSCSCWRCVGNDCQCCADERIQTTVTLIRNKADAPLAPVNGLPLVAA